MMKKESRLSASQIKAELKMLSGWKQAKGEISKTFEFANYYQTLAFVNASAWISHQENHHPDLEVGYNQCKVRYSTHSAGGLTAMDFKCAMKVEQIGQLK